MNKTKIIVYSTLTTFLFISIAFAFAYYNFIQPQNSVNNTSNSTSNFEFVSLSNPDTVFLKNQRNNEITLSRSTLITETVQQVSPAVVGINITKVNKYRDPNSSDPLFRYFFGDRIYQEKVQALGSGAIISSDGYIITNDHVAGNADEIIVTMTDGSEHPAKLIGSDHSTDICLLKIDGKNLPYIKMGNSNDILIGEWVIALGNPFGLFEINDKPTVTVGVVSATGMNLNSVNGRYYINMIQTDASINTGNSGGPLVNSIGQLVGMNTLIYSPNGNSGSVGVGFAIPINKVREVIHQIKTEGYVDRQFWTGLKIQAIDKHLAEYFNLSAVKGVIITDIIKNSPAAKAGLSVGDIITKIDQFPVSDDESIISILNQYTTGDKISIKIIRDKQYLTKQMKLDRKK